MYKLEEKLFLSKAIISNGNALINADYYHLGDNEELAKRSIAISLEMLKQRNELFGCSEKKSVKKDVANVDFEEIITIFNQTCFGLPEVTKSTKERNNAILKILETYTLQDIGQVFKNVSQSDYLMGKKVDWKANFDWILIPKNFIKIIEGGYNNIYNNNNKTYTASDTLKEKIAQRLNF
jgi:hypothetical protein